MPRTRTPYPPPANMDCDLEIDISPRSSPEPDADAEASFDACMLSLTNWVSKYVVYEMSGDDVIEPECMLNFRAVYETVYELMGCRFQTPFTLVHILAFIKKLVLDGYEILEEDLTQPGSDVIERLCLLLRLFFVLACEALEGDVDVEERMTLKEKMIITQSSRLANYEEARENVLEIIRSPVDNTIIMEDEEWLAFSDVLCAFALNHTIRIGRDDIVPVVVTSFLELSHASSKAGNVPFVDIPVKWLASYQGVEGEEFRARTPEDGWDLGGADCDVGMDYPIRRPKPRHAIDIALLERQSLYDSSS